MTLKFQTPELDGSDSSSTSCFQKFIVTRESQVWSPLVPKKGKQEHVITSVRTLLHDKVADQHCLVETPSTLRLQESVPMGRSWNQGHRSIPGVKRQTTYEDLRILKSVVRPQDFILSLDVERVCSVIRCSSENSYTPGL